MGPGTPTPVNGDGGGCCCEIGAAWGAGTGLPEAALEWVWVVGDEDVVHGVDAALDEATLDGEGREVWGVDDFVGREGGAEEGAAWEITGCFGDCAEDAGEVVVGAGTLLSPR
jgi:hypothetical protein